MTGSHAQVASIGFVVKLPSRPVSISFRAYSERIDDAATVLDWLVARLRATVPAGLELLCVCDSQVDMEEISQARSAHNGYRCLCVESRNDIEQNQLLMESLGLTHLMIGGLSHAIGPDAMLSDFLQMHLDLKTDLMSAACSWFTEPLHIMTKSMASMLAREQRQRRLSTDVLSAATTLQQLQRTEQHIGPPFRWIHVDISKRYRLAPEQEPEAVGVRSARDVEILCAAADFSKTGDVDTLSSYKRASIAVRQRRLRQASYTSAPDRPSTSSLRVLYASSLSGFTGAQQSLCHLVGAMPAEGVQAIALTSYEGTFTRALRSRGAHVICPNHNLARPDPENFVYCRQLLAEYRPDIVHINHTVGLPLITAAASAGIPLIEHVRIQTPASIADHIHAADGVITVSHFVRGLVAGLDVDMQKVHAIFNGVDTEQFAPSAELRRRYRNHLRISPDEFVVTTIARASKNKRHDIVVRAFASLRRMTGVGHLLMVGAGEHENDYFRTIIELCEGESVRGYTTVVEFMPDIRVAHHVSDALVLPSENEPLSRAVLEAMSMALPVVVADSGGSKEVIEHGTNGFVVPYGKSEPLTAILLELLRSQQRARAVGLSARDTVIASLTAAHCARKTVEFYRRFLRG